MIRLRGVRKRYTTAKLVNEVLKGIDLDIADGEFVAIVGRSGSGKTTLLNIVGALDTDFEGSVEVGDRDLRKLDDASISDYRNRNIGFVFQSFHLLEHMTCIENITLPSLFARGEGLLDKAAAVARAEEVLREVDLLDKRDALPSTLSGGQKQRVAIARALFQKPKLMICDEPTGNLDSSTAQAILALFRRLNEDHGITLVIVTHDDMISQACRRVVRIDDGLIVEGGGEFASRKPALAPTPESRAHDRAADDGKPEPAVPVMEATP